MLTAIFGGTFNPLHIGHYQMLKALNEDSKIEKILLMPDKIPPHKVCDFLAEDAIRIEMCKIAAKDFKKAELCLLEFEREGLSYTYDTILLLKSKFPDTEFAFVCGADMLVFFDKWYKYEELMKELPFIVFRRNDTDENELIACIEKFKSMGMQIELRDEEITSVSSTDIRKDFNSFSNLLPKNIYDFLIDRGVYNE